MARVVDLAPEDAKAMADYGRLTYEAAGAPAEIPPAVTEIMRRALALDARSPLALWFVGQAAEQAGRNAEARELWTRLLSLLEPGTPQYATLKARIDALPAIQ